MRHLLPFDKVYLEMNELREKIYELAEIETSLYKLGKEIKKVLREQMLLKKFKSLNKKKTLKEIEDVLAEKEREDFFRLKRVKGKVEE